MKIKSKKKPLTKEEYPVLAYRPDYLLKGRNPWVIWERMWGTDIFLMEKNPGIIIYPLPKLQ